MSRTDENDPRRKPRIVHRGELFERGEIDRGEAILEIVDAAPEPPEEPSEPWALGDAISEDHPHRGWLRRRLHR